MQKFYYALKMNVPYMDESPNSSDSHHYSHHEPQDSVSCGNNFKTNTLKTQTI